MLILFLYVRHKIDVSVKSAAILDNVRDEINRIMIEMNQTTDRNVGLIEGKIGALAKMIESADQRLSLLKRSREKSDKAAAVYTNLKPAVIRIPDNGDRKDPAADIPEKRGDIVPDKEPCIREQVIDLYRKGFDAKIIAARLNTAIGEVELMISLETGRM